MCPDCQLTQKTHTRPCVKNPDTGRHGAFNKSGVGICPVCGTVWQAHSGNVFIVVLDHDPGPAPKRRAARTKSLFSPKKMWKRKRRPGLA